MFFGLDPRLATFAALTANLPHSRAACPPNRQILWNINEPHRRYNAYPWPERIQLVMTPKNRLRGD